MSEMKSTAGSGQESTVDYARREGMPVALLLPYEALHIAQGHPLVVSTEDGGRVCVRLMDAHEYLKVQHEGADKYGAPRISFAQACQLARPLPEVSA